MAAYVKGILSK